MSAETITADNFDAAWMEDAERGGLYIRVAAFDNGGKTVDRYSIHVENSPPWGLNDDDVEPSFTFFSSTNPYSPNGVGLTDEGWRIGGEDSILVSFAELPEQVQHAVWSAAASHWILETPTGYVEFTYDFIDQTWIPNFVRRTP